VIVDNGVVTWYPSIGLIANTPLTNNLYADNVTITNYARVDLTDSVNVAGTILVSEDSHFYVTGSVTSNTITLSTSGWLYNESGSTTSYTTLNWTGGRITDNGGTMAVVSGGSALTVPTGSTLMGNTTRTFSSITVNGTLTHDANTTIETYKINYTSTGDLTVNASGDINANEKGFAAAQGPGEGTDHSAGAGGGAHGGNGGDGQAGSVSAAGGNAYGSYTEPSTLGSGGGDYAGQAGAGGGAIKLIVAGTTTINGTVSANGQDGWHNSGRVSGGGAGGSVWIDTGTLAGTGNIRANGGSTVNSTYDGGGGGGGRIALYYDSDTSTLNDLAANGGVAGAYGGGAIAQYGGAGTIYRMDNDDVSGHLIVDNNISTWYESKTLIATTPLANSLSAANLTIRDYARVDYDDTMNISGTITVSTNSHFTVTGSVTTGTLTLATNGWAYNESAGSTTYSTLNWTGGRITDNGGTMAVVSGGGALTVPTGSTLVGNTERTFSSVTINGTLTHDANATEEVYKINYTSTGDLTVSASGDINANEKGFGRSAGPGEGTDNSAGAGGGAHGGDGGDGQAGSVSGAGGDAYGSYTEPTTLGSGGGDYSGYAGVGGGAIKLTVSGTTTVNGTITANGQYGNGVSSRVSGGGAGGSVWIDTGTLAGTGNIRANGGSTVNSTYDGGGGGGGRVALYYDNDTSALNELAANGGVGSVYGGGAIAQLGGAGTIYRKDNDDALGNVILDNNIDTWYPNRELIATTPLANSLSAANLTITDYARVDYGDTMNITGTISVSTSSHLTVTGSVTTDILSFATNSWFHNENGGSTIYNTLNWTGISITDNGGTFALLSGGGALTVPNTSTVYAHAARTFSEIIINGLVTHYANSTSKEYFVDWTSTGDFTVGSLGAINVDYKGYGRAQGPGAGVSSSAGAGGAGHGGAGGAGQSAAGGVAYGSATEPTTMGSGGGDYSGYAGTGGGVIKITAAGTATINGAITAHGQIGNGVSARVSGGGAGGSIWISANTLAGTGQVRANGGTTINSTYDGGSGAGGRIALYFTTDESDFVGLSVDGGAGQHLGQPGEDGSIFLGGNPANPLNLRQFKSDSITAVAQGASTDESTFVASFLVSDGNNPETLTPEVEIQPLGTAFNNVPTHTGDNVTYEGTPISADVTIDGLADATSYHWQARACDSTSICSDWVSFGSNTEAEVDIRLILNTDPNAPVIPESSFYINGQFSNDTQPTLSFVLSDPNSIDSVKYRIQMNTSDDFSSPLVDYTSALAAQGTFSFTVGREVGDGNYDVGSVDQTLDSGNYYWRIMTIDNLDGDSAWTTAPGTPAFKIDQTRPTNATDVSMKAHAGATASYSEDENTNWFSRNDLYFTWTAGTDAEGVKGYCVYVGTDPEGDPATQKGLLGTSPVSTTGTSCEFIIDDTEIDFANSALRSFAWLSSSAEPYYFKVKTIDIANNVFVGADETNLVSFNFDNTAPQNVVAISAASGSFSNIQDMFFTWPTSGGAGGSDAHSGVLGFQYGLNSTANWQGENTDETTGVKYTSLGATQPYYFPEDVQDQIQIGQNTIYFKVIDVAGNTSELRTAYINYGGQAPEFEQGEFVSVSPTSSEENNFAFEWPEATASAGRTIAKYFYMVNTTPPAAYSTITSNSATYIETTETGIAPGRIPGLIKGSNTVYVVAVDDGGNYSPTNNVSATFILDTDLPDPATSLSVADNSIKDAEVWRASVVWSEPEYKGTGSLTYVVQRSEDGENWVDITTTTGNAYVDTVPESKPYFWRVGSYDNSNESIATPSFTNAVTITPKGTFTEPPTLISDPVASDITTANATVSWTTNREGDSRLAYGLASGNYFDSEPSKSEQVTTHVISLTNLSPGTEYYAKARWTDEDGNTGESEEFTFTTAPPPEVKDVEISSVGVSSAIVNFTTTNASKATVYYGESTAFGGIREIATAQIESNYTIELSGLTDGTEYYYRINTFDAEDNEYEGTILNFSTLPRPEVSNVQIEQITNTAQTSIVVTWESNTPISSVVTYYPENSPELVRDEVDVTLTDDQHSMIVKGLFPDTTYIIRVSGRDAIGNEAVSENVSITTAFDSRPPQISALRIEGSNLDSARNQDNPSQLIVSWTTDEPATSQVEYGDGTGTSYSQLTQEDQNLSYNHLVVIPNLSPAKVYHLRAISKDGANNEVRSVDTVTITPKATDQAFDLVITNLREVFGFLGDF